MKRFAFIAVTALLAASCLSDTGYEASYTIFATFDVNDTSWPESDSIIVNRAFAFGPLGFYNSYSEETPDVNAGWTLSKSHCPIASLVDDEGNLIPSTQTRVTPFCVSDTTDARPNQGRDAFLVFHEDLNAGMPEHHVEFLQASFGTCNPTQISLNTTAAVARYFRTSAQQGDYFKVTITGYRDGNETSSVEYCLADHRGSADSPDSLTTEWKTLNLMRLGNVQYIDFDIDAQFSNNTEGEDLNYFCMDNLFASIYISQ